MKTSNQLLIGLLIIIFAAIFGTATVLKNVYEGIDKDDPFYGYIHKPLEKFSAVRIEGKYPGVIQIQYAEKYEILQRGPSAEDFSWNIRNDTLILTHSATEYPKHFIGEYILSNRSNFYIMTPSLTSVRSEAICRIADWQLSTLELEQKGQGSGMALTESSIGNLSASVLQGGMIRIEQANQIKRASVKVRDISNFTVRPSAVDSLKLEIDSTAQIQLPGYLFGQLSF